MLKSITIKLIYLSIVILIIIATRSSVVGARINYTKIYDNNIDLAASAYKELTYDEKDYDSFLFFTDPHIYSYDKDDAFRESYYNCLEDIYKKSETNFIISGGDWIDMDDTVSQAKSKLENVKYEMYNRFDKYYLVVGNHDTNYQGEKRLSNAEISDIWYVNYNRAYYSFEGNKTRFYVFDTGIDWKDYMVKYRWKQLDWFAKELCANNDENIVLFMHIFTDYKDYKPTVFANNICKLSNAYNNKKAIKIDEKEYDFTNCKGKVRCILSGHIHGDYYGICNDIPVVTTINSCNSNKISCDLCYLDYKNDKLHMIRYGVGNSRHISI